MGRKIILLSDGTGNSAAKVWRTNVWRVFESLDLSHSDQVAFYDDGVGTSSFKPAAILGGAFGYGLKRNLLDLYKFACRNYRNDDDEIYGFGFSRGAFTIRLLIWFILEQGLVKADSEAELDVKAKAAYRAFRADNFHTFWHLEDIARWIRDLVLRSNYSKETNRQNPNVRFLGLWDTVAAYGMPIEEWARGISQWIWPWQLPSSRLDSRVQRACHALAIDDERTTFHPVLWDERQEKPLLPRQDGKCYLHDERISQVWFAGVHSNVGGGYPDDSLSQVSLVWIMQEAGRAGVRFKSAAAASPQTVEHPPTAQDKDGRLYDPRSGLGGYYRYGPRNILELCKDLLSREGGEVLPKIHESALQRIKNNAHLYAPKGLPQRYQVVDANGVVLAPENNPYEKPEQSRARANIQEEVWNLIWLRRIVYFTTVGVSVYLAGFPLARALPATDELTNPLRWLSDIVRMIGSFLPEAATTWINGYARAPGKFLGVGVALMICFFVGSWLAAKIQNKMSIYWRAALAGELVDGGEPQDLIYRLRTHWIYRAAHDALKRYVAPAAFAFLTLYVALTFASHATFNILDDAGYICRETGTKADLVNLSIKTAHKPDAIETQTVEFNTSNLCQSTGVWLEARGHYLITFDSTDSFYDDNIPAAKGFYSTDPPSLWQKAVMVSGVPLRRELIRPWFRIVARIGGKGGEESFLDPDLTDEHWINENITATRDGELFLFVNDAVIAIPGLYDYFYRNNKGSAKVTIKRTR
jgi:uncharacterized protein (DUF2235 family)